jgi:sugar phosphate isomerase/epimerase
MKQNSGDLPGSSRRAFLRTAGAGAGAATLARGADQHSVQRPLTDKEKYDRIASNSWPIRYIFKTPTNWTERDTEGAKMVETMKKKYGEITMLDFPNFTKETFPGIYQMDIFSGLFGDFSDPSMYVESQVVFQGKTHTVHEFDPSSVSGKKWLDRMANKMAATGAKCHHISNNAPRNISDLDEEKRRGGIEVAKKWIDGAATLGAKSMRVNSGGPRIAPCAVVTSDYPKNDELSKYLANCIESFKEMSDYGGKKGVKVTLENHWGLTANPINIQIIVDEVNHPYCEASPDFCNWENEYLLYHGLAALAPYAHTNVHAKYWNRWKNPDVQRNVKIMLNANYMGIFALEYEEGPWDGVEGSKYLYREVMAAL